MLVQPSTTASDKSIAMFNSEVFWASKACYLNDVFETKMIDLIKDRFFTIDVINELAKLWGLSDPNLNSLEVAHIELLRNQIENAIECINNKGIYSLSTEKHQKLLWALYADEMKGFVIEYDKKKLLSIPHETRGC